MLTTGSKWFFGLAAAAFAGALVYGGATNPSDVGMDTFTFVRLPFLPPALLCALSSG